MYHIDLKTDKLIHDAKVYFQLQGAVAAQVAFPEQYLNKDYVNQQFGFEAQMDVTFLDAKISLTGKVGKEPISGEGSVEFQASKIYSHVILNGNLDAKRGRLQVLKYTL